MSYQRINKSIKEIKNKNSRVYKSNERAFVRKRKMNFTDFVRKNENNNRTRFLCTNIYI